MITQPNKEAIMFERAITIFRPSRTVLQEASKLLKHFCTHRNANTQMHQCIPEIAVFIAENSQQLKDLKGRKISGMGLSLSRLISNSIFPIQLLICKLKQFIKIAQLDHQFRLQLQHYNNKIIQAVSSIELFEKFMNSLKLELSEDIKKTNYKQIFIELAWMLFIDCRQNYFVPDTLGEDKDCCLMASVLYFMVRYSLNYVYPVELKNDRSCEKRVIIGKILQLLLDIFEIQNIDLYKKIADRFDEYAQGLINNLTFRTVSSDTDFFSPFIINLNYKQLQNRYQKLLEPRSIDFRVFRKQRSATPINKEALLYRVELKKIENLGCSTKKQYKSHRMLDYEQQQIQSSRKDKNETQTDAANRRQPRAHKMLSSINLSGLGASAQSVNIEIYRYVKTLIKSNKRQRKVADHDLMQKIKQASSRNQKQSILSTQSFQLTIQLVFQALVNNLEHLNIQLITLKDSVLAMSTFIVEEMYYQNMNGKKVVDYLASQTCQSLTTLWHCLTFIYKNDENLAQTLRNKFLIETQDIIGQVIWKNNCYIDQLAELAANYQKNMVFITFSEALLSYCENFILKLKRQLQISQLHCKYAYNCLKFILSANGCILQGHHIDQILMCSIYIAGKTLGQPILFARIKQTYERLQSKNPEKCQKIFNCVTLQQNETGNIIGFYNKIFIQNIQPFVPYMSNPSLQLLHPLFQRQLRHQDHINYYESQQLQLTNLLQTKKPKPPCSKVGKMFDKVQSIGISINSERNETRVRVRPSNTIENELCETQRIKIYRNQEINN